MWNNILLLDLFWVVPDRKSLFYNLFLTLKDLWEEYFKYALLHKLEKNLSRASLIDNINKEDKDNNIIVVESNLNRFLLCNQIKVLTSEIWVIPKTKVENNKKDSSPEVKLLDFNNTILEGTIVPLAVPIVKDK